MQTKLFAAGLINVNHQPIVMKLPLKSFVWTTLPDPPTHGREKPRGWLTATRPLSTPADGWIYVCAQSRPANFAIFSLVLAAPLSLSRGFFSFLLLTNPLTRETDTLAITLASGEVLNTLLAGCFLPFFFFFFDGTSVEVNERLFSLRQFGLKRRSNQDKGFFFTGRENFTFFDLSW